VNLDRIPCSASKFSEDGAKLAVTTPDAVVVFDTDSGKELIKIPAAGVASTAFSPLGTYLQTFQKPQGQQKNLTLWDLETGAIVLQQFQKVISKSTWSVRSCLETPVCSTCGLNLCVLAWSFNVF
jgi:translation initiation factor 2A